MSSVERPPPSDGLSGRSLGILLGFLAAFLLVLAFGYYRRHAHLSALRDTGDAPRLDTIARRRRAGPRPVFAEVDVGHRAKQPTWTALQVKLFASLNAISSSPDNLRSLCQHEYTSRPVNATVRDLHHGDIRPQGTSRASWLPLGSADCRSMQYHHYLARRLIRRLHYRTHRRHRDPPNPSCK